MIDLVNINKYYKNKQVLFDFTFQINTNQNGIYGLIGPNGAGKTTILKLITGLLDYTSGSISTDESKNYNNWCKDNIVLIPAGERGLRYKNTIYDNILFFAAMKGISEKRTKKLIGDLAEEMNVSKLLHKRLETLSMGQKKKALLLCGLCTDMKIVIMDEPSNGLDIDSQMEMKDIIQKMVLKYNKTILISSHDLDFVSDIADHYLFVFQGRNVRELQNKMDTNKIREEYIKMKEQYGR